VKQTVTQKRFLPARVVLLMCGQTTWSPRGCWQHSVHAATWARTLDQDQSSARGTRPALTELFPARLTNHARRFFLGDAAGFSVN
jgi:hypothetical protein